MPATPSKTSRSRTLLFRVTETEAAVIETLAGSAGFGPRRLSGYLRLVALGRGRQPSAGGKVAPRTDDGPAHLFTLDDRQALRDLTRQTQAVGVLLNQMVRAMNIAAMGDVIGSGEANGLASRAVSFGKVDVPTVERAMEDLGVVTGRIRRWIEVVDQRRGKR